MKHTFLIVGLLFVKIIHKKEKFYLSEFCSKIIFSNPLQPCNMLVSSTQKTDHSNQMPIYVHRFFHSRQEHFRFSESIRTSTATNLEDRLPLLWLYIHPFQEMSNIAHSHNWKTWLSNILLMYHIFPSRMAQNLSTAFCRIGQLRDQGRTSSLMM